MSISSFRQANPLVIAVVAGLISSLFSLSPLKFSAITLILNYFATLPLFLVALEWGLTAAFISAGVVTLSFFIFTGAVGTFIHSLSITFPFLLLSWATFKQSVSESFKPAGYLISYVTIYSVSLFFLALFVLNQEGSFSAENLSKGINQFLFQNNVPATTSKIFIVLPALIGISMTVTLIANIALANRLLRLWKFENFRILSKKDADFHLYWDIVVVIGLLLQLTDHSLFAFIGANIALTACVPLFCLGLAILYEWFAQQENGWVWFTVVLLLCFFLVWLSVFVVLLGILESSLKIRKKLIKS